MYGNVLCDLPVIDIDDEGDPIERGKAYLDSLIREVRRENSGVCLTWQFSFDMVKFQHAHGPMFVVDCGLSVTRMWLLNDDSTQPRKKAIPRPMPDQYVAQISVGYAELTGDDLIRALAAMMADRVMSD
jgi:hypothetical protein